jgi:hypothetical protein
MLKKYYPIIKKFLSSVWAFPSILALILIILTAFQINGSSIGIYHQIFYGNEPDKDLLLNHPQSIRSDEYSVNSQMTIAQDHNDYKELNTHLGSGEDISILSNAPYRGWSILFHPENLGFLVLPFDNAFALKWWLPSFLLVVSAYFFILKLLPNRKLLAILLSASFLLSPFFQWWYLPGTLGAVYYCLFGILVFMRIFESKTRSDTLLWSGLLAYIATSFILILYPPFQIPCVLVSIAFIIGYLVNNKTSLREQMPKQKWLIFGGAIAVSLILVVTFIYQRFPAVQAIQNTAYPGQRVTKSGGTSFERFMSSNLSPFLQAGDRYRGLEGKEKNSVNQSELSSFILLIPFLLPLIGYILYKDRKRKKKLDFLLIGSLIVSAVFALWLFVPGLDIIGKVTLLDKVLVQRLIIGVGFVNFIILVLFIRLLIKSSVKFSNSLVTIYSLLIVIFYLLLNFHIALHYPGFIGYKSAVVFALPFAVIVFLLLKRLYVFAAAALFLFSLGSTFLINPLYKGTEVLSQSSVSQAIRKYNAEDQKTWVGDENYLENFPIMNGATSLTGTYLYPQLGLWSELDPKGKEKDLYNRYAHVNFAFDRDATKNIKPYFYRPNTDLFYVILEPCDAFLKKHNVGYLITRTAFKTDEAPCAELKEKITYPETSVYIYKLLH